MRQLYKHFVAVICILYPCIAKADVKEHSDHSRVLSDWGVRRGEVQRVQLECTYVTTRMKRSSAKEPDGSSVPPENVSYESTMHVFIDFERGLHRCDRWTYAFSDATLKLSPREQTTVFDAINRNFYRGMPNKPRGLMAPDVSLTSKKARDADAMHIGEEPIMFGFGYVLPSKDDGAGWRRSPSGEEFTILSRSPLRLRWHPNSDSRQWFYEYTIDTTNRNLIKNLRFMDGTQLVYTIDVAYSADEKAIPAEWTYTHYAGDAVVTATKYNVTDFQLNPVFTDDLFGMPVKAGMTLRNEDGFFRVQPDGESLVPINPLETAHGVSDKSWVNPRLLLLTGCVLCLVGLLWKVFRPTQ